MTALTDALEASRSKAIAALGKAYVSRTDEPDDELFAGLLVKIGEDDERKIGFLLAAWRILREQRADAPGEQAPADNGKRPASDAQKRLIESLCKERNLAYPDDVQTWEQAHGIIDSIKAGTYKAGTYKAEDWRVPF